MAEQTAPSSPDSKAVEYTKRLQEIRVRVGDLHRRIQTEGDRLAIADLHLEIGRVQELLRELVQVTEEKSDAGVAKSSESWPHDLNTEPAKGEWGTDPEEVSVG